MRHRIERRNRAVDIEQPLDAQVEFAFALPPAIRYDFAPIRHLEIGSEFGEQTPCAPFE